MHQDEHVCPRCGLILPTAEAYLRHWEQGCKHKESTYPNGCPILGGESKE